VAGADKWRNPDEDLPADFEANRAENYHKLRKPLDARKFTSELREEMDAELTPSTMRCHTWDWLEIKERRAGGAIILTPLAAAPEPVNLRRLKAAVKTAGASCRCWTCSPRQRCAPAA